MPLEDSEARRTPYNIPKEQKEFEREFAKLLEQINVDSTADILTNQDKFSLIIRKTNNLINFAGNKFIYYLKTSNNNKLSYISIDDYWIVKNINNSKRFGTKDIYYVYDNK